MLEMRYYLGLKESNENRGVFYEKRRNVSIAELIIGMSLVILLIGVVITKADSGYIKAEWERRRICSEIRYVKRKNIAGIREYMSIGKVNGVTYYKTVCGPKVTGMSYIDKDIKVSTVISRIFFQSSGVPERAGTITVNYKDKNYYVTITPISGRVLFKEGIYSDDE